MLVNALRQLRQDGQVDQHADKIDGGGNQSHADRQGAPRASSVQMTAKGVIAPGEAEGDGEPEEPAALPAQRVLGDPGGAQQQVGLAGGSAGSQDDPGNEQRQKGVDQPGQKQAKHVQAHCGAFFFTGHGWQVFSRRRDNSE